QHPSGELTFSIPKLVQRSSEVSKLLPELVAEQRGRVANPAAGEKEQTEKDLQAAEERATYWHKVQLYVFAAMMVGFAIKVPLFPVHTWLPLAHVEAPTAGSVLLAGVLLKIGSYGFMRFALPLVPQACWMGMHVVAVLSVVGIVYGAFLALAQDDIKKLVAY